MGTEAEKKVTVIIREVLKKSNMVQGQKELYADWGKAESPGPGWLAQTQWGKGVEVCMMKSRPENGQRKQWGQERRKEG